MGEAKNKALGLFTSLQGKTEGTIDDVKNSKQVKQGMALAENVKKEVQQNPYLKEIVLGILCKKK